MTIEELKYRQTWTLEQKIDHTVGAMEAFLAFLQSINRTPYISFSGGKDSTVLLDIARRFIDKDLKAVFCNTGNEFPEIVKFVRTFPNVTIIRPEMTVPQVIDKYGFPLISKEQSQGVRQCKTTKSEKLRNIRLYGSPGQKGYKAGKISDKWQFLIDEPFMVSEKCCECLKKRPFHIYGKKTGEAPIIGIIAGESKMRTGQYLQRGGCNSFDEKNLGCFPISIWTDSDIWTYIKKFNIPYCELYDKGTDRTGCMFCGFGAHMKDDTRFELLYDLHPKAYQRFMNYTNSGVTYRTALRKIGICLPDENRQLKLFYKIKMKIFNYNWNLKDTIFTKDKGKVFSCFSCGGGSTMGYKLAGFDVIGCNEIDHRMMYAYCRNHDPKFPFLEPIQEFKNKKDLPEELFDLDILDGSPPCSTFSMVGTRSESWGVEKKFTEGQQVQVLDTLFFDFIDLAKTLQPKVVTAEKHTFTENIFAIVKNLAYYKYSEEERVNYAICEIRRLCQILDINLPSIVDIKMKYNQTRPYKHGKAY